MEVRVESLKQVNIEIRATILSISMYFWTANRSIMVSCTPQMCLWGLLDIHIRHPGVLGGHGIKVEVRV